MERIANAGAALRNAAADANQGLPRAGTDMQM